MADITRMNATDCHAPWQTESDWYMVGAGGDGCDYEVVQGWKAVLSMMCRLIINGGTIQDAIDRHWDELRDHLRDLADEDCWSVTDNLPGRRPHYYSYDGEDFTFVIYLLTAPPASEVAQ